MTADAPCNRPAAGEAWRRSYWLWDLLFGVVVAAVTVLVLLSGESLVRIWVATGLLAAIAVLYAALGRRLILRDVQDGSSAGYYAAIIAALVAAALVVPEATYALFLVIPQAFFVLAPRPAVVTAVTLNALPVLVAVVTADDVPHALGQSAPMALLLGAFTLFVGLWVTRIIEQSDERALLINELEASRAEVATLSRLAGATAERERMAGEIHDTLAQGFTSVVTLLQAVQAELDIDEAQARRHLDLAVRTARENLAEARALVAGGAPDAGPLPDALRRQCERLTERTGIAAQLLDSGPPRRLGPEVEIVLLRAVQELLANVGKHAGAQAATVRLERREDAVVLGVRDDGAGFDPDAPADHGYGLRVLRGRVGRLGGQVTVRSAAGASTTVTVEVPA